MARRTRLRPAAGGAVLLLVVGLTPLLGQKSSPGSALPQGEMPQPSSRMVPELERLLSRLDRVAQLYRDAALEFSCKETIRDSAQGGRHDLEYLYVYDETEGFQDFRTRGRRSVTPVKFEDLGLDLVLHRSYSWAFVFLGGAHEFHEYEIVDTSDPSTIGIRFEPIPPYQEGLNDWFGTAWIDRESLQLIRVNAMKPADWEIYQEFERKLAMASKSSPYLRKERYLFTRVSTEFTVEKNGMRFPGKTRIETVRCRIRGGIADDRYHESEIRAVEQTYRDYEFFTVRTAEEIRQIVFGPAPS
jgi:hypothetical protein